MYGGNCGSCGPGARFHVFLKWVEPDAYFRIVHLAQVGHPSASVAAYCEQTIEIALGPKEAFENGNIGALSRRVQFV